jgi:transglutaminase-like putative cysteine protease
MRFKIRHETFYNYTGPVSLGPHAMRLRPREDGAQRVLSYSLEIKPEPSLVSHALDAEGNVVAHAWFMGTTERLRITSSFEVETLRANPFDYVPDPGFDKLPTPYPPSLAQRLAAYIEPGVGEASVREFARSVLAQSGPAPIAFLDALNRAIHDRIHRAVRDDGKSAQSAAETLALGKGACRDLTVLYMESCRSLGLAARFVSGYRRGELSRPDRHLHAWPEVYIPGGGWRGWDPVEALAVGATHVALAAGPAQVDTMPVEGAFYGAGVKAALTYRLHIAVDPA